MDTNARKRIYSLLSKLIYKELYEYGVDHENIFSLSLYLQLSVVKEYLLLRKEPSLTLINQLHKQLPGITKNDNAITELAKTLFIENIDIVNSIISTVNCPQKPNTQFHWLEEWKKTCSTALNHDLNTTKDLNYLMLLTAVQESLDLSLEAMSVTIKLISNIIEKKYSFENIN